MVLPEGAEEVSRGQAVGVLVEEGCHEILLLLHPYSWFLCVGEKGEKLGDCKNKEAPWIRMLAGAWSLPYLPLCVWVGGSSLRPLRTNMLPGYISSPQVGLASLICSIHLSISPGKRGISGPAKKESISPWLLISCGTLNRSPLPLVSETPLFSQEE